jgi:hypothetical protein
VQIIDFHVPVSPPFLGLYADYSVAVWLYAAPFEWRQGPQAPRVLLASVPEVPAEEAHYMVYEVFYMAGGHGPSEGLGSMDTGATLFESFHVSSLEELFATQFPPPGPD